MEEECMDETQTVEQQAPAHRPPRPVPYLTIGLILFSWSIHILKMFEILDESSVNSWGTMSAFNFLSGEWWRPLSSIFLHASLFHLTFNTVVLFILGRKVERALGHGGFACLYLATGLAASLAGYLNPLKTALGSSGAVFGVCGAWFFLHFRILSRVSSRARTHAVVGLLVILILFGPNTAAPILAHGIGLLAGILFMMLAWRPRCRWPRQRRLITQLGLVGCAVVLISIPLAIYPNPRRMSAQVYANMARGEFEQAMTALARLTRFYPAYDWPYLARYYCLRCLKRFEQAEQEIERGIARSPNSSQLWLEHGEIHLYRGIPSLAREDFAKACRLSGGDEGLRNYTEALCSLQSGDYKTAVKASTSAWQHNYEPYSAMTIRGKAYCALGKLAEAEADWRQAIDKSWDSGERAYTTMELGFLELRRGDWATALKRADEADAMSNGLNYLGLLRLIASDKLGRKIDMPDKSRVYHDLVPEDLVDLKTLLPQELWSYLEPIGKQKE